VIFFTKNGDNNDNKGKSDRRIAIYRPQSSSLVQQWMSWLSGRRPELIEPKSIACSDGRHGERTHSNYSIVTRQTNTRY